MEVGDRVELKPTYNIRHVSDILNVVAVTDTKVYTDKYTLVKVSNTSYYRIFDAYMHKKASLTTYLIKVIR